MSWSNEKVYSFILIIFAILFFALYSFNVWSLWLPNLSSFGHIIFNWPDANANYFFAKVYAESGTFMYPEYLNYISENLLHTRSINVYNANLVPMTFLPSLYVFGLFFKFLGDANVLWATPFLASLSAIIFYNLAKDIFKDKQLSFIMALLFMALAPWLYFANMVMLPTVLFIFLLLLSWKLFSLYFQKIDFVYWSLASVFLSLAILVRPTEFIWVLASTLLLFYFNKNRISFFLLIFAAIVFANFLYMALYLNNITYGNYLSVGYQNLQTGDLPTELLDSKLNFLSFIKLMIMPFGFNFKLILSNFYNYFVEIIWPYLIFASVGFYYLVIKIKNKNNNHDIWKKYFVATNIIFIFVLLYYASWDLADPVVKNLNKISISYIRYFMPLYILTIPLTAYGIKRLFFKEKNLLSSTIVYFMVFLIATVSIRIAFFSPNDGLLKNRQNIIEYYYQYEDVSKIVKKNAVIISDRSDKVFFPVYKVVVPQGDLPLWPRVANLIKESEVYYYTNKTDNALILTKEKALDSGLKFEEPVNIYNDYRIFKISN